MKRKPPKNQRPYASPSGKKARLTMVVEPEWSLLRMAQGDIGVPHAIPDMQLTSCGWADAAQLAKWRASQVTSGAKE